MSNNNKKALVVFSGGQDSTTCLHWAFREFGVENVETLTFDYGQKHSIELEAAKKICEINQVDFDLVKIPNVLRSSSPLVDSKESLEKYDSLEGFEKIKANESIPATFVPGRNILFFTIAANIALSKQCSHIVTGVCEADFAGYYDCRNDFIKAMEEALNQGLFGDESKIKILTPLMYLSKKESVELAKDLGEKCLNSLAYSHTCYDGTFPPCGKCHACHLRQRGFQEAGIEDPLISRAKAYQVSA